MQSAVDYQAAAITIVNSGSCLSVCVVSPILCNVSNLMLKTARVTLG